MTPVSNHIYWMVFLSKAFLFAFVSGGGVRWDGGDRLTCRILLSNTNKHQCDLSNITHGIYRTSILNYVTFGLIFLVNS